MQIIENIVIILVFAGAIIYVGNLILKPFLSKNEQAGCAKNCGSACGGCSFNELEKK